MDYKKIEKFWKSTANGHDRFSTMLTNMDFAKFRHVSEQKKVFSYLNLDLNKMVLDLGCGPGRWTIPLSFYCKKVVAVDYIDEPDFWSLDNVEYHKQNILSFKTDEKFDIIFLAGVLQYLDDTDVQKILEKCYNWLEEKGQLIIISTVSLNEPFKRMDNNFEGYFRTINQYLKFIDKFDNYDYMDSHGLYLFGFNKYKMLDYVANSFLAKNFRVWYTKKFREYPAIPIIFICRK